jgi:small subunit ribosomal protein S15
MLTKTKKLKVIKTAAVHASDTGSPEVQVSLLTKRIEELTDHLKKHSSDKHSRRGLLQMVAGRQNHLNYLHKKDPKRYSALTKKLNLKKKS